MATNFWVGIAPLQRNTLLFTCSAPTLGATRYVEFNGRRVTVIATDTSASTLATQFYEAIRTSTDAYVKDGTPSVDGATFTVVGPADGAPLTSPAVSTGVTLTTNTAGTGPYHADNVLNYSSGALPGNGDTLIFLYGQAGTGPRYGLSALTAVTLALLKVLDSYLGNIGLPRNRGAYIEHRPRYLESKGDEFEIYSRNADNDERFKILATKAGATVWILSGGGSSGANGVPVELSGLLSTSTVSAVNTGVSISPEAAAVSTLTTIVATNANVLLSTGVTLSTGITMTGGQLTTAVDVKAAVLKNVQCFFNEDADGSPISLSGGALTWKSSQASGTISLFDNAVLDFSQAPAVLTPAAAFVMSSGTKLIDGGRLAAGYTVTPQGCAVQDLLLDLPVGRGVTTV